MFYNLGVNIQFISNGKITLRTLATEEMFVCHTAANLKDTILLVLSRFNINVKQIYSCTTDNGRNMVKFVELLNDDDLPGCGDQYEENCDEIDSELPFMDDFVIDSKCIGL